MADPVEGRVRATIHPLRPRGRRGASGDVQFAFRIDNYAQLSCAYGPAVAHRAVARVVGLLADLVGEGGLITREANGLVRAFVWEPTALGPGAIDRACARLIESVAAMTALLPIGGEPDTVHVSVSGAWCAPDALDGAVDGRGALAALDRLQMAGEPPTNTEAWVRRFRADMAEAAALFEALARGRAHLVRQPVRGSADRGQVLYEECLLRASNDAGRELSPAVVLPALERLGLVRALDHHVASHVVEQLARDPAVTLGVNISAQSATLDGLWVAIIERLSRRPDVARRLVLEITETAQLPSISDATAFGWRMRKLGCRLALDDFGAAHFSIPQILAFKPDIVKTDGLLLKRAGISPQDRAAFHHLVGIATALAPVVIAEGAATEAQFNMGRESGAQWQQGHFLGAPTPLATSPEGDDGGRLDPLRAVRAWRSSAAQRGPRGVAS